MFVSIGLLYFRKIYRCSHATDTFLSHMLFKKYYTKRREMKNNNKRINHWNYFDTNFEPDMMVYSTNRSNRGKKTISFVLKFNTVKLAEHEKLAFYFCMAFNGYRSLGCKKGINLSLRHSKVYNDFFFGKFFFRHIQKYHFVNIDLWFFHF